MNAAVRTPGCADALRDRNPVAVTTGCLTPNVVVRIFQAAGLGTAGWVVATPVAEGNGTFVFSQVGGLHVLPVPDLPEFDKAVCSTSEPPSDWKSAAAGPAGCNP